MSSVLSVVFPGSVSRSVSPVTRPAVHPPSILSFVEQQDGMELAVAAEMTPTSHLGIGQASTAEAGKCCGGAVAVPILTDSLDPLLAPRTLFEHGCFPSCLSASHLVRLLLDNLDLATYLAT